MYCSLWASNDRDLWKIDLVLTESPINLRISIQMDNTLDKSRQACYPAEAEMTWLKTPESWSFELCYDYNTSNFFAYNTFAYITSNFLQLIIVQCILTEFNY